MIIYDHIDHIVMKVDNMFKHPPPPEEKVHSDPNEPDEPCPPPPFHRAPFDGPCDDFPTHRPCRHGPGRHHAPRPPHPPGPFGRGPMHEDEEDGPDFPPPFPPMGMFGGFRPKMMMQKEFFQELRYFFILSILNDIPEGITGYRLQDKFQFPRGNILRLLDELVEQKYISVEDSVVEGRAQKIFKISEEGKKYLHELKQRWAEFFSHMSDQAPFEEFAPPFAPKAGMEHLFHMIQECKNKDDAIDIVRGIRAQITREHERIEQRLNRLDQRKGKLDELVKYIEKMDSFNVDEIKKFLDTLK